MWRRILAFMLLGSIAHAQMAAVTDPAQIPGNQPPPSTSQSESARNGRPQARSSPQPPSRVARPPLTELFVSTYQRHQQLRREREEQLAVLVCRPRYQRLGCQLGDLAEQAEIVPVSLKLNRVEGFRVRYRVGQEFRIQAEGPAARTQVGSSVFRLKIRADKTAALGPHVLEGKLTLQVRSGGDLAETQEIPVSIPLEVVEHDARVEEAHWSLEAPNHHHIGTIVLLTLTAPFWGPLFLIFLAAYEIDGGG
jgi:hypothetical protein